MANTKTEEKILKVLNLDKKGATKEYHNVFPHGSVMGKDENDFRQREKLSGNGPFPSARRVQRWKKRRYPFGLFRAFAGANLYVGQQSGQNPGDVPDRQMA